MLTAIGYVLPVAVLYGIALFLVIRARARLQTAVSSPSPRLIDAARNLAIAATVMIGVGFASNGTLALFTTLEASTITNNGQLTGEGNVGISTTGGWIGLIAADFAQWPLLIAAAVALLYVIFALAATRQTFSPDRRWWWDGGAWRLVA